MTDPDTTPQQDPTSATRGPVTATCLRCHLPIAQAVPRGLWIDLPAGSDQCGSQHGDIHVAHADLIAATWNSITETWTVSARASLSDEWSTFEGAEEELGSLLSTARDVVTGGGPLSQPG